MRAGISLLVTAIVLALSLLVHAQGKGSGYSVSFGSSCPNTLEPQTMRLRNIRFDGSLQLSSNEQAEIASELRKRDYNQPVQLDEYVRDAWQRRGYFKVVADSHVSKPEETPAGLIADAIIFVKEGSLYTFKSLKWVNAERFRPEEL